MEQKSWYSMAIEDVLKGLKTGFDGLTEDEAKSRLQEFGPNELVAEKKISPLQILVSQFKNILIVILLFATALSFMIGEYIDAIVILAIVIACAILGFVQEYRAERALEALKKMLAPTITVLRDGKEIEISSKELVPGDLILLEVGDKIPADARLLEIANLQIDEAPLTGESVSVAKMVDALPESTYVADRKNMVFSGTTVTYGRGKAVVTNTGMSTEFGKIAKEVAAVEEEKTPLEKRTEEIGKWLGTLCLAVCFAVVGFGIIREYFVEGLLTGGFILEMIMFGIALAVAAVPEALPAIVTGTLAIGMREMANRNALIRRMPAVETLGCTTVVCADKTGTLTKGEMTVRRIYADGRFIEVSGVGYEPRGELRAGSGGVDVKVGALPTLMTASILCNDARLEETGGRWYIKGDPTEGALIVVAEKAGFHQNEIRTRYPRIGELPFSSERKRMSTVHQSPEGKRIVYVKGAPEIILERCAFINEGGEIEKLRVSKKDGILKMNADMAQSALRVLGVAYKELPETVRVLDEESLENNLIFLGLVGMIDPPREEAIQAVEVCKKVKMKPIMITGDHRLTAIAIAKEMGIFKEGDIVLTGEELEGMNDEEFERIVDKVTVYARVSPIHKLKIVKAWKARGQVVAMTGDGVNDAPAVKQADIGIAMGITGTEVTKEASDMVLADDNFATIVKAIERGRWVFDNIKKYLTYLLQCNLIEIIVIGGGVLAGLPLPLLPAQILWVNLVTDGAPALALGVSPPDPDIMERPPRDPEETVFVREVRAMLIALPLMLSPLLMLAFLNDLALSVEEARTTLFLIFVFFELVIALNCRSLKHSVFKAKPHRALWLGVLSSALPTLGILWIPAIRDAFGVIVPTLFDIVLAAGLSFLPLFIIEALKLTLTRYPHVLKQ
ncbi:MAG: cation-translocating P-type ATPase [Candidatus Geothermarchaeales archaeon]